MLDLVYPRFDLWTEATLDDNSKPGFYISEQSRRSLKIISRPLCRTCGFPLEGDTEDSAACEHCRHLNAVFESNRSVLLLDRLGRKIIHQLKYHEGFYLLPDIAIILGNCESLRARVAGHLLVPVPLHSRKLRERGYNQSLLLAEVFKDVWGDRDTEILELLTRTKDTDSQTLMDRKTRVANVKEAFVFKTGLVVNTDRPVTLVDDVFTTGSTINACAMQLRKAGFSRIAALTLGHG